MYTLEVISTLEVLSLLKYFRNTEVLFTVAKYFRVYEVHIILTSDIKINEACFYFPVSLNLFKYNFIATIILFKSLCIMV